MECLYFGMVIRVVVALGVVFLLVWISTNNFQGRFFSKEGEVDKLVGQGGFVNKTWFYNQIDPIKDELYERISNEILSEKKAYGKPILSEKEADVDTGDPSGRSVKTGDPGDPGGRSVETGDPDFKFSIREGRGSWRQRQLKRVRRLQNVCSRHPERSSFIESEKRR